MLAWPTSMRLSYMKQNKQKTFVGLTTFKSQLPLYATVVAQHTLCTSPSTIRHCRMIEFDVTNGQYVVSVRNLGRAIVIRHKTLSDDEVKVCRPPWQNCSGPKTPGIKRR